MFISPLLDLLKSDQHGGNQVENSKGNSEDEVEDILGVASIARLRTRADGIEHRHLLLRHMVPKTTMVQLQMLQFDSRPNFEMNAICDY